MILLKAYCITIQFMELLFDSRNITITSLFSLVIVISIVEMYFSYAHDRKLYTKKDTLNNLYLMLTAIFINASMKFATFFLLQYCYQFRLFQIENVWLYWLVLILGQDFLYWFLHTVGHYVRIFWAMHVTHHSSTHFNLTTGFRSTVFEPLYRVFFYLPLAFMGFNALDILFAYLITQIYGNLVHTQTIGKLHSIIEYIFVTPSHHRVHHASNVRYLDKNMGMVFILWDRLFGTFQEEILTEPIKYGLTHPIDDSNFTNIVFHEFVALSNDVKKAPSFLDKIKYIIKPPGWSHDGSTQTTKLMHKQLIKVENLRNSGAVQSPNPELKQA